MRVSEVSTFAAPRWEIWARVHHRRVSDLPMSRDRAMSKYGSKNVRFYRMIREWGFIQAPRSCEFEHPHRARWHRKSSSWMWECEAPYRSDEYPARDECSGERSTGTRSRDWLYRVRSLMSYPSYLRWLTLLPSVAWYRFYYSGGHAPRGRDHEACRSDGRWVREIERGDTTESLKEIILYDHKELFLVYGVCSSWVWVHSSNRVFWNARNSPTPI